MNHLICSIHQPNFFPWIGYFLKISQSDIFIILDDVQTQKTAGSYANRVSIISSARHKWLVAPIKRKSGVWNISDTQYHDSIPWRNQILGLIENSYRKAPFFKEFFPFLKNLILFPSNSLVEFNLNSLKAIMEYLSMPYEDKIIISSSLNIQTQATQRLIDLTKSVNAQTYLCGNGSDGYLEKNMFKQQNIQLKFMNIEPIHYPQLNLNEFVPGQSIIDVLMNFSRENTIRYIKEEEIK